MKNFRVLITIILPSAAFWFLSSNVQAAPKTYILCDRAPQFTAVLPAYESSRDPCSGSVVLQGMAYRCGKLSDVESSTNEFLSGLRSGGRSVCQEECAKRSTDTVKCTGVYLPPTKCGFTVPPREALRFGKDEVPCNPDCTGQAFAYCSIYHASFLTVDPALFKGRAPNCICKPE